MKQTTFRLTSMSFLVALAILLKRLGSIRLVIAGVEGVRLGFGSLPVVMAGAMFGPVGGGIVGALEDLVGYFINPAGAYMPNFTVASALTGIIPGLILMSRREQVPSVLHLALAVGAGQAVASVGLTTYWLETLFGIPRAVTIPPRIASLVINMALYPVMIRLLLLRLSGAGVLSRLGVLAHNKDAS